METVIVIGAGISGLACAYRLRQLGIDCEVLEAADKPGGLIATIRRDGYLFETGPQCPRFAAGVWGLVRELGLETEFVAGPTKAKRYIFRRGRLREAPFSPGGLIATDLVGLSSKLRVLAEPFTRSRPPANEETLAEFVQRKFGAEVLDNLVDPIVSTVFFGDTAKMGMESAFPALVDWERRYGSVARGAIRASNSKPKETRGSLRVTDALPALGSFRCGMGRLPERLAEALDGKVKYGAKVQSLTGCADGVTRSGWQVGLGNGENLGASQVVLAVPTHAGATLLENAAPAVASELRAIEYAPMFLVSSAYRRASVEHPLDGFGFMVPRQEGLNTICTFWNSSLFPQRAPDDTVLMTTFARVVLDGDAGSAESKLAASVEAENAKILGIKDKSIDRVVWRDAQALPQYNVGHAVRVARIFETLKTVPRQHLAGNYLTGRSIGDCVDNGFRVAAEVYSQVASKHIQ